MRYTPRRYSLVRMLRTWMLLIALLAQAGYAAPVRADHTPDPSSVAIVGSFQQELGCLDDWQPECAATDLGFDAEDGVWQGTFNVPGGSWEYKAALNDSWAESYGAGGVQDGPNIPLNLGATTDVKFYYDHKTHWVTDNVNSTIATVAGSFQSELGCSDDWQPWCLRSWMQDADGDGVYAFSTDQLPGGSYEFKVALNEAWESSFPGSNVPFTSTDGDTVTFTYDSATNDVAVDTGAPTIEPGDELLVRPVVRVPAQENVFYFVMPDRFDNGDPSNDAGGDLSGDPLVNGLLPTDKGYYHGGDLAGLTARLPYLDALGITAIWMTPQFTNRWVQGDGTLGGSTAGYHGYWQINYSSIDPHFGTNAEMQAFVAAAHALGIDVFFDIVANHTGNVIAYAESTFTYRDKTDYPYLDASNVPFDDRDFAGTGSFPALDPAISFPYTPVFATPADATIKSPAWLNNPIYYHNRGDSTFSGESSLYGDFFGLDDLFTEHPTVQDGLIQVFKDMVTDFDIDGFRIDTVKHVNDEFWKAFAPELEAHAASLGKPDFFAFGEVYDGNPAFLSRFTTDLPLDAVLDFAFQGTARNFAGQSGNTDNVRAFYENDDYYIDADSNAYALPLFLGNHDLGRIGLFLNQDNPGAADAELVARDELAHALLYFGRGMPVVYYGDEQGFVGDGGDKDARQDMMPSVVASYNDDDLIGTAATTAGSNFDSTHPLYQTLSDFGQLLAAHPALTRGAQLHRYSEGSAGIYAFSRIERAEKVEYVVALNNSGTADSATFHTDSPSASFTELWPGVGPALSSDGAGNVTVGVPGLGVKLYRADAPIPSRAVGIHVTLHAPAEGAEVLGRFEVGATLAEDRYAEVTFAVSVDGGPFEPIGTDDNAPYRVFFNASGLTPGTGLEFKAIVDDRSGNLSSDKGTAVVGAEEPPAASGSDYAIIHYNRPAGDYGDHTTGDFDDFWGLHLWGDAIDPSEVTDWPDPKPFLGADAFGRFAWIKRGGDGSQVNFIAHQGDTKDTPNDRFFDADVNPEVWINQGDETVYSSQADAQGYVTIHYHRDDGDYGTPGPDFNTFWGLHLWGDAIDPAEGTDWTAPKPFDGIDDYGAYWNVAIQDATLPVNFILHRGDTKDPGPDQNMIPVEDASIWIQSGDETIYPGRGAAENVVTLHYHRDDGDYGDPTSGDYMDFWGLHVWDGALNPNPGWTDPVRWDHLDSYGPAFVVPLQAGAAQLAYILHRGDTKDPGTDQFLVLDEFGYEVWQLQGVGPDPDVPHYVLPIAGVSAAPGNLDSQKAYWVAEDRIVWGVAGDPAADYRLYYAPTGGLALDAVDIGGGSSIELAPAPSFPDGVDGLRHLAGMPTLQIAPEDRVLVPGILKGQIAVLAVKDGARVDATGLQIPGVLDDLYSYHGDLGVTWQSGLPTIRVWAPTAKSVSLHLFDDSAPATTGAATPMTVDPATGVWSVTGGASWKGKYYLFEVEVYVHSTGQVEHNLVTDPYSLSLAMNSTRSQIVDLENRVLEPRGWDRIQKPPLVAPEDITLYELHIRDFSANDDTVPDPWQGTYRAFTLRRSDGMRHLAALADAGLTHVHLLPAFDIATINENKAEWQEADPDLLADFPPDSEEQQALVTQYEDLDGFNWGYDPFHYTTPEGSYSTQPDGPVRIRQFRQMVQALNRTGLRVVMDVVYNHTNSAGQAAKSVLDRIVPGYYHRLDDQGQVETSTCCANTASEHAMMEKLMIDSLVTWAKQYKVDGFRFDLMGHHSLANMQNVRAALDALTLVKDGVDGSSIYLYGEGWNFGEVADDARFIQATQLNLGGTGIGSFSDRLRDAVRGGSPFDGGQDLIRRQGFANGLFYDPNALNSAPEPAPEPASVTIAGSLQDELGCPGEWQADCAATHLAFDAADSVWQGTFVVPDGSYEYKATLDDLWDENYGANAERNGSNIALNLGTSTDVKFYYSHATHWVIDDVNAVIATVPGSYQDEIGCPGDWQPDCLRSWLQDPNGDGIYSFSTGDIPPGSYEAKVAIDEDWAENYGADGVPNGPNILFTVEAGQTVLFSYDAVSHVLTISYGASDQLAELLLLTDQIRVGMAGNLADYQFTDRNGNLVTGSQVDYNGQPAGYTLDPQEDITYISKHDNQTLYDNNTYKAPVATSMAERTRIQNVGLSTVLLGQGVPFMQAGSDMLRSKSFDRDSFNSGDWFNKLDFSYQSNNYGVGLPVAGKNQDNWPIMQPLLANPDLMPAMTDIQFSAALVQELLQIRSSSPLFRLRTAEEVQARVTYHNTGPGQIPGLIVMSLSDLVEPDLDRGQELLVVLINANDKAQSVTVPDLAGNELTLHPVQVTSVDDVVKTASVDGETGAFTVPGRTTAVFAFAPQEMIRSLIQEVEALVEAGHLNRGQGRALIVKLENAIQNLDKGKPHTALNNLNAFVNQVKAFVKRGVLSPQEGQALIATAKAIRDQIKALYPVP